MVHTLHQVAPIKLITFDLEGPQFVLEYEHFEAFVIATKEIANIVTSAEELKREIPNAVGGGDELIAKGIERLSQVKDCWERILAAKKKNFARLVREKEILPRPGVEDAMRQLADARYKLAIGSLTLKEEALRYLSGTRIPDLIPWEHMVFAEDVSNKKPLPEVYHRTAELAGVRSIEQLVIEDSPTGLQAARAAGSRAIATPLEGFSDMQKIQMEQPVRIIHDWREIHIVEMVRNIESKP